MPGLCRATCRGGAAQQRAFGFALGPAGGGAELGDVFAVGVDQRDVDAILRRPAHQADRQYRGAGRQFGRDLLGHDAPWKPLH
jgi:hypothetical protein